MARLGQKALREAEIILGTFLTHERLEPIKDKILELLAGKAAGSVSGSTHQYQQEFLEMLDNG